MKQNADNAKQASGLAKEASTTTERGGEVVSRVVKTMHDIAGSSQQVADITGVIDSIAFQTDIMDEISAASQEQTNRLEEAVAVFTLSSATRACWAPGQQLMEVLSSSRLPNSPGRQGRVSCGSGVNGFAATVIHYTITFLAPAPMKGMVALPERVPVHA